MVKEFTIGFSRTINLGNFESARVEASITCDASEKDAQTILRQLLEDTYKAQMAKKKVA